MLNSLTIVGRLVSDPQINETENGDKVSTIILAIPRSYKNIDGAYDTDFIPVSLWNGIASNTCEYCRKGDLIGVKGRVAKLGDEEMIVVAEKITFLATKPKEEA